MLHKVLCYSTRLPARLLLPVLLLLLPASAIYAKNDIASLIQNGSYVLRTPAKQYSHNEDIRFVPASTTKLMTALAALHYLGSDYRFTTRLYVTGNHDLYIEGGGDPFLTSETITRLASQLKNHGIDTIHNLVLDSTSYNTPEQPAGALNSVNPYDTRNGALVVNFNSLAILKTDKQIVSAEEQTPTIPLVQQIGKTLPQGVHRVNVWAFSQNDDISLRYTKELFSAIFTHEGIAIQGRIIAGNTKPASPPLIVYRSEKNLTEMIRLCLKYSSNYVANQIFLEIGKQQYGTPATWSKGRKAMNLFIQSMFTANPPDIVEGSGLSRQNRISANQLITILDQLSPMVQEIMPLKEGIMVKSGTLTDVYCYAGYFRYCNRLYPFAILLNQQNNSRDAILKLLHNQFSIDKSSEKPSSSPPPRESFQKYQ